jgi:arsenate reductase (thioredoxin)
MKNELSADLRLRLEREANHLAREFAGIFEPETVRAALFDAAERMPAAKTDEYRHVFAYRFGREMLRAAARTRGRIDASRPQILFVCVHNAGRSQMAAGFALSMAPGRVEVLSAGSAPTGGVNPTVVDAMKEVGIDLAEAYPKPLTDEFVRASDVVVTMGCGDACPVFPGKRYEDWKTDDPAGRSIEEVRLVRDAIRDHVRRLLEELGVLSG